MAIQSIELIDWAVFAHARSHTGANIVRLLHFFREDGIKSVGQIEDAMRARNAAAIIGPAELVKADAEQIGAIQLAELAQEIEFGARDCVDWHQEPDVLLESILKLRPLLEESLAVLEREANPLWRRATGSLSA
jgi:histidine phosphotransfer protein HptB